MNDCVAFAAYRLLGKSEPKMIIQYNGNPAINRQQCIFDSDGFIMSPFVENNDKPTIMIKADKILHGDKDVFAELEAINIGLNNYDRRYEDNYEDAYNLFSRALQKNMFQKLVLSTCLLQDVTTSPLKMFIKACKNYTRMMVYICYTKQTGMWIGCTPEIIIDGKDNHWHTMALAGTLPLIQGRMPKHWNEKNIKEQRLVAEYIYNVLLDNASHIETSKAYAQRAGQLAHLRTDFDFILSPNKILNLLHSLSPTPAVCGLPKDDAYKFINAMEGYDRRYYAGIIGPISKDEAHLYVNLRCAEIYADKLMMYAGGGILRESNEDDEKHEVEEKIKTIQDLI